MDANDLKGLYAEATKRMDVSLEHVKHELGGVRTGRASVTMLDAVPPEAFLDEALSRAARMYESDANLRAKIKSAMTYPVMVLCLSLVAVIVMLTPFSFTL